MEIELQGNKVGINSSSFTMQSDLWLWDDRLTDGDKIKLMRLYWRYDFFRSKNKGKGIPATNYMYLTQEAYSDLLNIPRNKVSALFGRLENCNYLVRVKGGTQKMVNGVLENVPRDYVVILNPSHTDYSKELKDVWFVLSKRLDSLEDKGKTGSKTYIQMKSSYKRLFGDKNRHVGSVVEEDSGNYGHLSDIEVSEVPVYDLVPLSTYEDYLDSPPMYQEYDREINEDSQTFYDWELEEPPF